MLIGEIQSGNLPSRASSVHRSGLDDDEDADAEGKKENRERTQEATELHRSENKAKSCRVDTRDLVVELDDRRKISELG